jgi:hypothetical protein
MVNDVVCPGQPNVGSGRRFWVAATWLVGLLAFGKGIGLPNRWAATQAQIDYSQGFVKRGLFGTIVTNPLHLFVYSRFVVFSYLLFGLLALALVWLALTSRVSERVGGAEWLALYFGSYSVTALADTVGYFDIPLALCAVLILSVRSVAWRFVCGAIGTVLCLFVHEMFLIVFVPVLVLSFLIQGMGDESPRRRWFIVAAGLTLGVIATGTTLKLAWRQPMSEGQMSHLRSNIASRVDFVPREDFYYVLIHSAHDNADIMRAVHRDHGWILREVESVAVFGPTIVLLMVAIWRSLRASRVATVRWIFPVTALCVCSPLAMHLIAWDGPRWNGLVCLTAFLALIVVVRYTRGIALPSSLRWERAVSCVLFVSLASGGLLVEKNDDPFPWGLRVTTTAKSLQHMSLAEIANQSR